MKKYSSVPKKIIHMQIKVLHEIFFAPFKNFFSPLAILQKLHYTQAQRDTLLHIRRNANFFTSYTLRLNCIFHRIVYLHQISETLYPFFHRKRIISF